MGQRRLRAETRSKKRLVRRGRRGRVGRGGDQVRGEKRDLRE